MYLKFVKKFVLYTQIILIIIIGIIKFKFVQSR